MNAKISLKHYISKNKKNIIAYILINLIASACTILETIFLHQV